MAIDGECDCGSAECSVCGAGADAGKVELDSEDAGSDDAVLEDAPEGGEAASS